MAEQLVPEKFINFFICILSSSAESVAKICTYRLVLCCLSSKVLMF